MRGERDPGASGHAERLRKRFEAGAFWAAVLLPVAYVPVLAVDAGRLKRGLLLAAFVALHLLALWARRAHAR